MNNFIEPRDFNASFGGVYAPEGYWKNADGELVEITEMEPIYKSRTIKHIFKALPTKDKTGLVVFSGRYADSIAKKLEEFGCEVKSNGKKFVVQSID